ncbi:kinase-like protein [Xylaria sp. FL1777]|nr:kinase-like protein [Xylaria sp. FL1777]
MPLNRLARHMPFSRLSHLTGIRWASTAIVGESGRVYVQGEVLRRRLQDHNLSIFQSRNQTLVLKRVPRPFYNQSLLAAKFIGCRSTLLSLIQNSKEFSRLLLQKILRRIAEAIDELYNKNWAYIDIKLDNVLLNWTVDNEGNEVITDVVLGDSDLARKLEDGHALETGYAIGNVMWRSLEGQTGTTVTKASDIFSFGLVCIYTLGGGSFLFIGDYEEMKKVGATLEQEIVTRHFSYFGPVPSGLLMRINNEHWRLNDDPEMRFTTWGAELGPVALDMISGMTNLDPKARTTITEVLSHLWWQATDSIGG